MSGTPSVPEGVATRAEAVEAVIAIVDHAQDAARRADRGLVARKAAEAAVDGLRVDLRDGDPFAGYTGPTAVPASVRLVRGWVADTGSDIPECTHGYRLTDSCPGCDALDEANGITRGPDLDDDPITWCDCRSPADAPSHAGRCRFGSLHARRVAEYMAPEPPPALLSDLRAALEAARDGGAISPAEWAAFAMVPVGHGDAAAASAVVRLAGTA